MQKMKNTLNVQNLTHPYMVEMGEHTGILGTKVSFMRMSHYCVCHVMVR